MLTVGDVILLIDLKCPLCNTEQAYSNVSYSVGGNKCCTHCGYIFPEVYVGKLVEQINK